MTGTTRSRRDLARDAGEGLLSPLSIIAGVLVAFGAVALVAAAGGALGSQLGLRTGGISTGEWRRAGIAGVVTASVVLFLAFLFGGYTAGRMGARAGALHGLLVFAVAALSIGVVWALAGTWGDPGEVADQIRGNGVPTDASTWADIGIAAAIAGTAAMLLGSVLGGSEGARWHRQLDRIGAAVADAEAEESREGRRLWRLRPTPKREVIDLSDAEPPHSTRATDPEDLASAGRGVERLP